MSRLDLIDWNLEPVSMYDRPECPDCVDRELRNESAREYLEAIVKQLYSKEPLNTHELENDLDELCHYLHVKLVAADLTIDRKKGE